MQITQSPSPNRSGRAGYKAEVIVVHITDGSFPGDLNHLRNPKPGTSAGPVSAHFLLAPSGEIHQLVALEVASWHSGRVLTPTAPLKKKVLGYVNPNLYTVGIEVSLKPPALMSEAQLKSLHWLIRDYLCPKLGISLDRAHIWGHKEIFAAKTCPGTINVDALVRDMTPPLAPTPPSEAGTGPIGALVRDARGKLDEASGLLKEILDRL